MSHTSTIPAQSVSVRRPETAKEYYTSSRDAFWFEVDSTVCLVLIWLVLAGTMLGWLPAIVIVLSPILYVRFELGTHELLHCRTGRDLNPILRMMVVGQAFFHLSYDGYRSHHLAHHRYLGTDQDPERYLIASPPWLALLKSMFCVEMAAIHWTRAHRQKLSLSFYVEAALHAGIFVALWLWNWQAFLLYFACFRVGVGLADFFFHHCLHNENHRVTQAFRWLTDRWPWLISGPLGNKRLAILLYHDSHHKNPLIAVHHLEDLQPR